MDGNTFNQSASGDQLPLDLSGQGRTKKEPRMSSREIAEVCDKRHDNVKRTIETLVDRGVIVRPQIEDEQDVDAMGRPRTTSVYLVSKRDSYVVVAQLSPEFTARLVDRWQELEAQAVAPALPDFSNPVAAARAWADAFEREQAASTRMIEAESRVISLAPKAEAYDVLEAAEGSVTVRIAAKVLGVPERKLIKWMMLNSWAFRQNGVGTLQAYVDKRNRGYLDHRPRPYTDRNGEERISAQMVVTAKGLARLAYLLRDEPKISDK